MTPPIAAGRLPACRPEREQAGDGVAAGIGYPIGKLVTRLFGA